MYTIKQVSDMLGIPAVTIRAWENRYQAVVPNRTESGYRLYGADQVEELKWLKDQVDHKGLSIRQAVQLLEQHRNRRGTAAPGHAYQRPEPALTEGHQEHLDQLYDLLIRFRTEEAHNLVELGFTMFGYEAMVYKVLVHLMVRVGDAWEQGIVSVAQEHYVTQFVIQHCFRFFNVFPINPALPKAVSFCPPGEQHHAGLLMFSLFLRKRGLEVLYLGPDTPEDGLRSIFNSENIDLVCLSLTDRKLQGQTLTFIDRLVNGMTQLEIVLGGHGFEGAPEPYASWLLPPAMEAWEQWLNERLKAVH
ncbi:MerR family transcriptional regulator [Paenibacillus sp. PL2-23]|uniref:MerR family transcriptional regulator n=1 Tax=Paenibacillus sp. PL2-23 TaxID=2100729 RepID=UPI0030F5DE41